MKARITWQAEWPGGSFRARTMNSCEVATWDDVCAAARRYHASRGLPEPENICAIGLYNLRSEWEAFHGEPANPWYAFADYTPPPVKPKANKFQQVIVYAGKVWPAP